MADTNNIKQALWKVDEQAMQNADSKLNEYFLEQYKLYVEMADRISQRRGAANTFFLSFNTAIVGALAAFFDNVPSQVAIAFYVAAAVLAITWAVVLRSYRTLNTAKFQVVGLMEERLPCSPWWSAEWMALDEGKNWRTHIPLGPIETVVPLIFLALYGYLAWVSLSGHSVG